MMTTRRVSKFLSQAAVGLRVTAIVRAVGTSRRDAWTDGGVRDFGHAVTFAVNAMQPVRRVCWPSRVRWVGDSSGIVGATSPISA